MVGQSVCWSVTHSFDDPHGAPYWPTWPCYLLVFPSLQLGFGIITCLAILYSIAILAVGCQVKMDDTADALDGVCGETG